MKHKYYHRHDKNENKKDVLEWGHCSIIVKIILISHRLTLYHLYKPCVLLLQILFQFLTLYHLYKHKTFIRNRLKFFISLLVSIRIGLIH